jgi:hypothetical protein
MSSQRRVDSSRANGAKSHGPKTPEGREKSSLNSLKHGLTAEALIVDGEDPGDFASFVDTAVSHLKPQNDFELDLVLEIVHLRWRLRRVTAVETGIYDDRQCVIERLSPDYSGRDPHVRTSLLYTAASKAIDLLSRYESRLNRRYQQAVATFFKFRAAKSQPAEVGQASRPVEKSGKIEPNPGIEHQDDAKTMPANIHDEVLIDTPTPRKPGTKDAA